MPTIVVHEETGMRYVLVGTGYAFFKDSRPSFFGGDLFPHEEEGEFPMASVTDESGKIHWFPTRELRVLQVDGMSLAEILKKAAAIPNQRVENVQV